MRKITLEGYYNENDQFINPPSIEEINENKIDPVDENHLIKYLSKKLKSLDIIYDRDKIVYFTEDELFLLNLLLEIDLKNNNENTVEEDEEWKSTKKNPIFIFCILFIIIGMPLGIWYKSNNASAENNNTKTETVNEFDDWSYNCCKCTGTGQLSNYNGYTKCDMCVSGKISRYRYYNNCK